MNNLLFICSDNYFSLSAIFKGEFVRDRRGICQNYAQQPHSHKAFQPPEKRKEEKKKKKRFAQRQLKGFPQDMRFAAPPPGANTPDAKALASNSPIRCRTGQRKGISNKGKRALALRI